jgi:type II secretory pathway pseudopilin PulG
MARRTRAGERTRRASRGPREAGFTYLFVLFLVALLGVGLAAAGEAWQSQRLRGAEAELLWTGDQYRRAINAYYRNASGCGAERGRYPRQLADLVKDPRCPATVRYLRKLYPDPVTGGDWELVRAPDGGIAGVRSPSTQRPFKVADFRVQDRDFENKKAYREWVFLGASPTGAARGAQQVVPGTGQVVPGATQPFPGGSPQPTAPGGSPQLPSLGGMPSTAPPWDTLNAPGTVSQPLDATYESPTR